MLFKAKTFYEAWKNPSASKSKFSDSFKRMSLKNTTEIKRSDSEKGLERIGR